MEAFLDACRDVMAAYLAPAAPAAPAAYPLLGDVVAAEPGVSLVARRVVDPAEDPTCSTTRWARDVSRTRSRAHRRWPLMPLAMSLELLAEAAAALVPGQVVTGLLDVRAHRWLAWGEAPRTLELTARRVAADGPGEHVRVELRDLGERRRRRPRPPPSSSRAPSGSSRAYRAAPARSSRGAPPARGRPRSTPGAMYGEAMFHQAAVAGRARARHGRPGGRAAPPARARPARRPARLRRPRRPSSSTPSCSTPPAR